MLIWILIIVIIMIILIIIITPGKHITYNTANYNLKEITVDQVDERISVLIFVMVWWGFNPMMMSLFEAKKKALNFRISSVFFSAKKKI